MRWKRENENQFISTDRELDAEIPQGLVSSFPKSGQRTTAFWAQDQSSFLHLSEGKPPLVGGPSPLPNSKVMVSMPLPR